MADETPVRPVTKRVTVPPIPASCEHRPTIGGLVRPWINVELADGGLDFRSQHRSRAEQAIVHRLCQVCGTGLRHPIVLLGGPNQLRRLMFAEPPLHPECAVYTSHACPMVAGRMDRTRLGPTLAEGPRGAACPIDGCDCDGWTNHSRPSAPDTYAEPHPWYAIYVAAYSHVRDQHGALLAITQPDVVLRVRLVSKPGEGRCWENVADALGDYEPPAFHTINTNGE